MPVRRICYSLEFNRKFRQRVLTNDKSFSNSRKQQKKKNKKRKDNKTFHIHIFPEWICSKKKKKSTHTNTQILLLHNTILVKRQRDKVTFYKLTKNVVPSPRLYIYIYMIRNKIWQCLSNSFFRIFIFFKTLYIYNIREEISIIYIHTHT